MELSSNKCRKEDESRRKDGVGRQLLESRQYLGIARRTATRLKRKFPWVPTDDLYSYALFGLVRAANNYDPDRRVPFRIYACRKAMFVAIDEMRRDRVLCRGYRNPRPNAISLDKLVVTDQTNWWRLCDQTARKARLRLEAREWCAIMLSQLKPEDRRLILLRYTDDMTFRQIGQVMGMSESTICLRHKALIRRLRMLAKELHPSTPRAAAGTGLTS